MKEVCSRNGGTSMKYKHKKINIFKKSVDIFYKNSIIKSAYQIAGVVQW